MSKFEVRDMRYKMKNTRANARQVTDEEQTLKQELVEAKLDSTIFSPFYKVTMTPICNYEI